MSNKVSAITGVFDDTTGALKSISRDCGGASTGTPTPIATLSAAQQAAIDAGGSAVVVNSSGVLVDRNLSPVSGAGNSVVAIAFSTSIPFTQQSDMGIKQVSGPLALTALTTGAVRNSSCIVTFVANGANIPTFSGISAADSDRGYVNTSGVVNTLTTWYDGLKYYFQWSQDAALSPVVLPATEISLTGPTSGSVGSASTAFTVGANGTITGSVVVTPSDASGGGTFTPTSVSLTPGSPTGTFTYNAGSDGAKTISAANNGGLANPPSISYAAATLVPAVRFTNNASVTEATDTPTTGLFTYAANAGVSTYGSARGSANTSLPNNTDGSVYFALAGAVVAGVKAGATQPAVSAFGTFTLGVFDYGASGTYNLVGAGIIPSGNGSVAKIAGDRLRIVVRSNLCYAEVERSANPGVWINIPLVGTGTVPPVRSAALWPVFDMALTGNTVSATKGASWT